jgi:integrase
MVYNPVRGLKKPKPGERGRRMERDEELNLFVLAKNPKVAHERLAEDARFVALQRELGCRPGELRKLRRDDVDVEARAVRIRDAKNGDARIVHAVREAHGLLGAQRVQAEAQAPDSPDLFTPRSAEDGSPVPFCYTAAIRRLRKANIVGNDFHAHARVGNGPRARSKPDCLSRTSASKLTIDRSRSSRPATSLTRCIPKGARTLRRRSDDAGGRGMPQEE